ncbi:MAG: methyltransferase domain-containing protein [Pseudomonadota bacterium]
MKEALHTKIVSLLNLEEQSNLHVLDIGCGQGSLLNHLAGVMGPTAKLIGIDSTDRPLAIARESFPSLEFRKEKFIDRLSFEDNSFDLVVSVDTLECIPNKSVFLSEIFRVLKPGGTVLCAHWDWDTQVYNSENIQRVRTFVAAFADWKQGWMEAADGQMGRRLWGLFEGSGKFTGDIASFTLLETAYRAGEYGFDRLRDLSGLVKAGSLDRVEYESFLTEMQDLAAERQYFYSVNSYIYVGKPRNG